jgi:hypothetical protein
LRRHAGRHPQAKGPIHKGKRRRNPLTPRKNKKMSAKFSDMLKSTLDTMSEKIELVNQNFEGEVKLTMVKSLRNLQKYLGFNITLAATSNLRFLDFFGFLACWASWNFP